MPRFSFTLVTTLIVVAATVVPAQRKAPQPSPSPKQQEQEPIRVFTEEVRLPIVALDEYGHYDPTLEPDDILVIEDGVPQQIRSVRHTPANVLIVLDTGGELSGLGGMSKRTNLTRQIAMELVRHLHQGDWVALLQFNNKVDLLQPWSTDREAASQVLKTKVFSGKRAHFSEAVAAAAEQIKVRPEGNRHVVFITDGVDTAGAKTDRAKAIKRLIASRATVHIISYTEYVRQQNKSRSKNIEVGQLPPASDPITATDPTLPPGSTRSPSYRVGIRFDPAMRRQRKAYEDETEKSQQVLIALANETGGRIFLPKSSEEMVAQAVAVAREIGAEYLVTYRPTRPLASAEPAEYRRIEVAARRVGLTLRSRRGYVARPAQ